MNIAEVSIKRPIFILMILFGIIILGILGYSRLPINLFPDVDDPVLVVIAPYPGTSSSEMETLVTKPLEDSLSTVENLDTLSSSTKEGVTIISVKFKSGTDLKFAELKVRQKIDAVKHRLPDDMENPIINKFSSEDIPVAVISINGEKSQSGLTELVNNEIKIPIEATNGVGGISLYNGIDKIIEVTIDKSLLNSTGLSYKDIMVAISSNNISYPAGTISGVNKEITIRVSGKADSLDELGEITLKSKEGKIVRIKDIAKIEYSTQDENSRARMNGKSAVMFSVFKQSGANTVSVVDALKETVAKLQKKYGSSIKLSFVMETGSEIKESVDGVKSDMLMGALLSIIVVWLFLGNFRSTMITALALPTSILGAFFLIYVAGFSINIMTLLALSLATGLLIDDSIVVRENIFRQIENGLSPKEAAIKGTNEVALAVLSTTLAILAVFLPISFLNGMIGQFLKQFGLTIAFALLISLLDAFTNAPMLSAYWYKKGNENPRGIALFFSNLSKTWNKFYDKMINIYSSILKWSLDHKKIVISGVVVLLIISIVLSSFIGMNFINNPGSSYVVSLETYPGAPLNKMDRIVSDIEKFISKLDDVSFYYSRIGLDDQKNKGTINVNLKKIKERKKSMQEMIKITREYIKSKPEKDFYYTVAEESMGGDSVSSPIAINIYGNDFRELEKISRNMVKILSESPGVVDASSSLKPGTPELIVKLDNLKAKQLEISVTDVGRTLSQLLMGEKVSNYTHQNKDYDIVVRLSKDERKNITDLKNIIVISATGEKVMLGSFCTFEYSSTPLEIKRENSQRIVNVTANMMDGYSLNQVIPTIQKKFDRKLIIPEGYNYEFTGDQDDLQDLVQQMLLAIVLALFFMYMILASLYNSLIQPFYLMLSIPFAFIGIFILLLISGISLDIYGFIGILLVCGLVAKNAILLIDFINKKRKEGVSLREAIIESGKIRLRPILMTSFTMIFGMLPLALGLNTGSIGRQALPISVIGGLISSTFLTVIVIPVIYEGIERFLEKKKLKKAEKATKSLEVKPVIETNQ